LIGIEDAIQRGLGIPKHWQVYLLKVIVDMCFNLGLAGLKGFRKMIGHLEVGAYSNAAEEMKDSKWYWEVGNRSRRLVKMMATGHDYDPKEKFDLTK